MIDDGERVKKSKKLLSTMIANISVLSVIKTAIEVPDIKQKMLDDITQLESIFLKHFHEEVSHYNALQILFTLLHIEDKDLIDGLRNIAKMLANGRDLLEEAYADGILTLDGVELIQATTLELDKNVQDFIAIVQENVPSNVKNIFKHMSTLQ